MKMMKVSTSISQYLTVPISIRYFLSESASLHQHLPASTSIYQHSPASTSIHQHPPASTSIHQHPPASTSITQYLPVSTSICHLQREKKHRKRYFHEISLSLHFYLVYRYSTKFINSCKYFTTNNKCYKYFFNCIDVIVK